MYSKKNDPSIKPSNRSNSIKPCGSPSSSLQITSSSSAEPKSSNEVQDEKSFANSSILDNSLKINDTFTDSQQSNSFNSLQLSGNVGNTQNPENSFDISLNLSPTVQSSDSSQLVDIFNPGKIDHIESQQSGSIGCSPDLGCGLQFELSQDFSQHPQELVKSHKEIKEQDSNYSKICDKGSHNKKFLAPTSQPTCSKYLDPTNQLTSVENKNMSDVHSDSFEEKNINVEKMSTSFDDLQESNRITLSYVKRTIQENGYSIDEFCSLLKGKKKDQPKKPELIFEGQHCFAFWQNYYFAADVVHIDNENNLITVRYDDDSTAKLKENEIHFKTDFEKNQKTHVLDERTQGYAVGYILHSERVGGETKYWCVVGNDLSKIVGRFSLRFRRDYLYDKPLPRKSITFKSGRKRKIEPAEQQSSSSTSTSTSTSTADDEVEEEGKVKVVKEIKTDKKANKKKKVKINEFQLFASYSFLITKDQGDAEDTSLDTTTSEEQQEGATNKKKNSSRTKFNEHKAIQTIRKEGGSYYDKFTSTRDLFKKGTIRVCLTDMERTSTNNYSVKFLYCIATGIPVVHYDWLTTCVKERTIINYAPYTIPAGRDITGDIIEQKLGATLEECRNFPYTPLNGVRIHVHLDETMKASSREIFFLLEKLGSEVHQIHHITKKSKRIPFDPNTIDYVITFSDEVPDLLVRTCHTHNKHILTREWLVQCVINNRLLDVDSPLFRYAEPVIG